MCCEIIENRITLDGLMGTQCFTKEELEHIAYALKAVAHPNRLAIICLLSRNEELNVSEICEQMACSQALISHHLICTQKVFFKSGVKDVTPIIVWPTIG